MIMDGRFSKFYYVRKPRLLHINRIEISNFLILTDLLELKRNV